MVEDWPLSLADVPRLPLALLKPVVGTGPRAPKLTPTVAAGRRNVTLFTEACRLRRLGYDRDEIRAALSALNQKRCNPPLPDTDIDGLASRAATYDPAADTYPLTEAGDAEFFVAQFGERLRFDHRRGRWLLFNDHLWVPDTDAGIHRLALDAVRARQRAAIGHKDRVTWAVKGESHGRLRHLLEIAKTLQPIADDGSQWDLDPWCLGVANGILDLRAGTLRDGRPEDRVTMTCPVTFVPDATCPNWDAFLHQVFDDDAVRAYVQRACGYSLTGDCQEECLFFCWGEGANGKSTLLGAVGFTLGDYADDLPFSALEWQDRGGGIPNDIAKIVGRRFITSSESGESKRLNEARVKALTGRDPITARFLHQEFFTFQPMAKFWLASNSKPIVRDNSAGFWRRLHLIPFTQSFVGRENKTLKEDLRREASGILAWAVRGCLAWQRDGLNPPAVVRQATDDYRQESDVLAPFYDACCTIDTTAHVQASALFARYQRWCESNHIWKEQRLTQKAFGLKIRSRFAADEKSHVVTYRGIGLQPQPDAGPNLGY
jgi:putative DNA primase/helicase